MRLVVWLLRAFIFFTLFAFALNNQQSATVNWFFGVQWHAPMVIVVLITFAAGAALGVLAMVPSWWRQRRMAQRGVVPASSPSAAAGPATQAPPSSTLPADAAAAHPPREL
jgi:uncharacterized integral membrane protein